MRSALYTFRLLTIAVILLPAIKRRALSRALERLGPSYIKLGQTLSTRADLIGEEMAAELASLRDQLPPFDSRVARAIIEQEFGRPLDDFCRAFEDMPVAAASVAQVHRATLANGREVAIKVIRPRVKKAFARDIAFFYWLARMIERFSPASRRLKPVEVVRLLEQSVAFELDLRYEAAAMAQTAENCAKDGGLRIPRVDWDLTAERVLVTEWIDGIPIHEVAALRAAGHDPDALLATLSELFFKQVFRDGFFHADLHPGNILVDAAGNIVLIDFGIVGQLERSERLYVAEIFRGFLNADYRHVAEMHFRAGYVPPHHSVEAFTLAARAIAEPILGRPVQEISLARLLGQLFKVTEAFDMETQTQLLLLQKSMVVVEGVGRMLNPPVNMWEMARPPIEAWARENLSIPGRARHAALDARDLAERLPDILHQSKMALDRLSDPRGIRVHPVSMEYLLADRRARHRQWVLIALLALAMAAYAIFK